MKRITSVIISLIITFCHFAPLTCVNAKEYTDITGGGTATEYASREQAVGKFMDAVGTEKFSTNSSILDKYSDKGKISLAYMDRMSAAVYSGLINGYEDGTLRPRDAISRAEALVILGRALSRTELPAKNDNSFTDTPQWAEKHINRLAAAGIVKGYGDGTLGASDLLTLEQVSMLCDRISRVTGPAGNYYNFVNSAWLEKTELSDGTSYVSEMNDIAMDVSEKISDIIFSLYKRHYNDGENFADNSKENKIITVYSAAANQSHRDKTGLKPIEPLLDKIDSVKNINDVVEVMAELEKNGFPTLIKVSLDKDVRTSDKYLPAISGAYTGIDNTLFAAENSEKYVEIYREYIERLFELSGADDPQTSASYTVELCKTLADSTKFSVTSSNLSSELLYCEKKKINKLYGTSLIEKYFDLLGFSKAKEIIIYDKNLVNTVGMLLNEENLEKIKAYLSASVLDASALYLTTDMFNAYSECGNKLSGTESSEIPSDYAAAITEELLGWELGSIYVDEYFSDNAKSQVNEIVSDIKEGYEKLIKSCTRMTPASRNKVVNKLRKIKVYCGYPENIDDYCNDTVIFRPIEDGGNLMEYRMLIAQTYTKACAEAINGKTEILDGWYIYPQTVNAMYDPTTNSITVPAGIISAPFFESSAEYEQNLGGIGMIIAHEISHAFDLTGSQFDGDGKLSEIWNEQDKLAFNEICAEISKEYGDIKKGNIYVNGERTANENIADISGMSCVISIAESKSLNLDKVFKSYAKMWRIKSTEEYDEYMLNTDTHSPNEVRVNRVLSNFKEFDDLYGVIDGDGMYLSDEQKINIWR